MNSEIKNYFNKNIDEIRISGYEKINARYACKFLTKSKKVLYIGSGDGLMIKEILKINKLLKIHGVELSSKLVSESKKNIPNVKIFNKDIFDLNIKYQYDTVISFSFLQYLNLKEIHKLQKKLIKDFNPNFIIHLSIPNYDYRIDFLKTMKEKISKFNYFLSIFRFFFGYKIFNNKPYSYYHKVNLIKKLNIKNYSCKIKIQSDSFYRFDYMLLK